VVAVSDSSAADHDEDGLDIAVVRKHKDETGASPTARRRRDPDPTSR
jgi:hypothetical protein